MAFLHPSSILPSLDLCVFKISFPLFLDFENCSQCYSKNQHLTNACMHVIASPISRFLILVLILNSQLHTTQGYLISFTNSTMTEVNRPHVQRSPHQPSLIAYTIPPLLPETSARSSQPGSTTYWVKSHPGPLCWQLTCIVSCSPAKAELSYHFLRFLSILVGW